MPSRFEPCGLSQLLALRYRSIPLVRETGGLKDTVQSYNEMTGEGNGFSFTYYNADDYWYTLKRALAFYKDEEVWRKIVDNAGKEDYSWNRSAKAYMALYEQLVVSRKGTEQWPVTL
jgi:starch synthase